MKEKRRHRCLEKEEIELYIIDEDYDEEDLIASHLDCCYDCYVQYFELCAFQEILDFELRKPISAEIRSLVRGIQTTNYG
ncbi:MAG: hypothetical protein ACE5G1_03300 [bacterium]